MRSWRGKDKNSWLEKAGYRRLQAWRICQKSMVVPGLEGKTVGKEGSQHTPRVKQTGLWWETLPIRSAPLSESHLMTSPGPGLHGALPLLYPKQGIKVPPLTSPSHQEKPDIHREPRKAKMKALGGGGTGRERVEIKQGKEKQGCMGVGLLTKPSLFLRNTNT